MDESLFEYYDMHLTGMVVSNAEEASADDETAYEPELEFDC